MSCHRAVCQECATTWDGINYCAACLESRRQAAGPRASWLGLAVVVGAATGLIWILTRVMVWASVLAVELL
jgi:hypothetical protein